jgi:DNA adenine methylase
MLAPWIIEHFPEHRVYVEPFGGAASVLLQKAPAYSEVYNDLEGDVVNLFRVLQDLAKAEDLRRRLHLTPFAGDEFQRSYEPPATTSTARTRCCAVRSWAMDPRR